MGVQVLRTTKWAKELYIRAYAEILQPLVQSRAEAE